MQQALAFLLELIERYHTDPLICAEAQRHRFRIEHFGRESGPSVPPPWIPNPFIPPFFPIPGTAAPQIPPEPTTSPNPTIVLPATTILPIPIRRIDTVGPTFTIDNPPVQGEIK